MEPPGGWRSFTPIVALFLCDGLISEAEDKLLQSDNKNKDRACAEEVAQGWTAGV